jgi:hypothetical protein
MMDAPIGPGQSRLEPADGGLPREVAAPAASAGLRTGPENAIAGRR